MAILTAHFFSCGWHIHGLSTALPHHAGLRVLSQGFCTEQSQSPPQTLSYISLFSAVNNTVGYKEA